MGIHSHIAVQLSLICTESHGTKAKALIVLGLAACALGSHSYHGYSYAPQNYGYGFTIGSHGYHKRAADASEPHYEPALAYHPAGGYGYNKYGPGYSYEYRSPQGLQKREADASEPHHEPAIAHHPAGGYGYHKYGPGYSYEYRSTQGLHKREAEPSYKPALAYHPAGGYGYHKYGPGYIYEYRSPQGLHKRDASGASYQTVYRTDCYGYNCQNTEYGVKVHGYEANVYENRHGH